MHRLIALFKEMSPWLKAVTVFIVVAGQMGFMMFIIEEALQICTFGAFPLQEGNANEELARHVRLCWFVHQQAEFLIVYFGWLNPLFWPAYLLYLQSDQGYWLSMKEIAKFHGEWSGPEAEKTATWLQNLTIFSEILFTLTVLAIFAWAAYQVHKELKGDSDNDDGDGGPGPNAGTGDGDGPLSGGQADRESGSHDNSQGRASALGSNLWLPGRGREDDS